MSIFDPRPQVGQAAQFDPVAEPRRNLLVPDTVAAMGPRVAAPDGFDQLAQSLQNVNPEIQQWLSDKQDVQNQADAVQSKADQIKSGLDFGAAVRNGTIPAYASPTYIAGWKEMDGQNAADAARQQWEEEAKTGPISSNTDPKAVSAWINGKIQDTVAGLGDDPSVLAGALPGLKQYGAQLQSSMLEKANANAQYGFQNTVATSLSQVVAKAVTDANQNGTDVDINSLGQQLVNVRNHALVSGLDPKTTDLLTTQAVVTTAEETKNPSLLEALMHPRQDVNDPSKIIPGIGMTGAGQQLILEATHRIHAEQAQDNAEKWQAQEHALVMNEQAGNAVGTKMLMANGGMMTPDIEAAITKADPSGKSLEAALRLTTAIHSNSAYSSPVDAADQEYLLYTGDTGRNTDGTPRSVAQMAHEEVASGAFHGTAAEAISYMDKAQKLDESGILAYPEVKLLASRISGDMASGVSAIIKDPIAAQQASNAFYNQVTQWALAEKAAGRDPSVGIAKEAQAVLDQVTTPSKGTPGEPTSAAPKAPSNNSSSKLLNTMSDDDIEAASEVRGDPAQMQKYRDKYTPQALTAAGF